MFRPRPLLAGFPAFLLIAALGAGNAHAMSSYRWQQRPLVVFAPSADDPRLAAQLAIVRSSRAAFAKRDMVVIAVAGNRVTMVLGPGQNLGALALRRRFRVGRAAFRTLLVGKDAGVKLSSSAPIAARRLFRLIDQMPMRLEEIRRRR